jgi:hypothetical protein
LIIRATKVTVFVALWFAVYQGNTNFSDFKKSGNYKAD